MTSHILVPWPYIRGIPKIMVYVGSLWSYVVLRTPKAPAALRWRLVAQTGPEDDDQDGQVQQCSEPEQNTVESKKLEYGFGVIYASFPSFFALGSEDGQIPTFWLLLQWRVGLC